MLYPTVQCFEKVILCHLAENSIKEKGIIKKKSLKMPMCIVHLLKDIIHVKLNYSKAQ